MIQVYIRTTMGETVALPDMLFLSSKLFSRISVFPHNENVK